MNTCLDLKECFNILLLEIYYSFIMRKNIKIFDDVEKVYSKNVFQIQKRIYL